jgi:hypothetical protein
MGGLGVRAVAIRGDELGDWFTMRCDNVAAALADAAKEFGKLSIGIGGGDGLFHGGSNSSDITYYTANENSKPAPLISQEA